MNPTLDVAGQTGLRDIRGPVPIPSPWTLPLAIAGAIVIGLLLGLWVARRRGREKPAEPAPPADRVALERLERARALLDPARAREFVGLASSVVREYVEAISGTHAPRLTTDEFLRELARAQTSPLAASRGLLEDFLRHCDLVKFARAELARDEMEGLLDSARRVVIETRTTVPGPAPAPVRVQEVAER